eukprot:SAG31_NODE_7321_length_1719_cov_18.388272_3_plen_357_part_00
MVTPRDADLVRCESASVRSESASRHASERMPKATTRFWKDTRLTFVRHLGGALKRAGVEQWVPTALLVPSDDAVGGDKWMRGLWGRCADLEHWYWLRATDCYGYDCGDGLYLLSMMVGKVKYVRPVADAQGDFKARSKRQAAGSAELLQPPNGHGAEPTPEVRRKLQTVMSDFATEFADTMTRYVALVNGPALRPADGDSTNSTPRSAALVRFAESAPVGAVVGAVRAVADAVGAVCEASGEEAKITAFMQFPPNMQGPMLTTMSRAASAAVDLQTRLDQIRDAPSARTVLDMFISEPLRRQFKVTTLRSTSVRPAAASYDELDDGTASRLQGMLAEIAKAAAKILFPQDPQVSRS